MIWLKFLLFLMSTIRTEGVGKTFVQLRYNSPERSTFGLRNCYCISCNASNSVGVVVNDQCFFISMDDRLNISSGETNGGTIVQDLYKPLVISTENHLRIFEQLTNELSLKLKKDLTIIIFANNVLEFIERQGPLAKKIKGFSPDQNVRVNIHYDESYKSRIFDSTESLIVGPTILIANPFNCTIIPAYNTIKYDACTFDQSALATDNPNECVAALPSNMYCELTAIHASEELERIHNYLVTLTQPDADILVSNSSRYQIFFLGNAVWKGENSNYKVFRVRANEEPYLVIDVQGKQIFYNGDKPTLKLCTITQQDNGGGRKDEVEESIVTDFSPEIVSKLSSENTQNDGACTYGLPSCRCNKCDINFTVGKLYNNVCYFASIESTMRSDTRDGSKSDLIMDEYKKVIISNEIEGRIFQQICKDLLHIQGERHISLYIDGQSMSKYINPPPIGKPQRCLRYNVMENTVQSVCDKSNIVFLATKPGEYKSCPPFIPFEYNTCLFKNFSAATSKTDTCFEATEGSCNVLANVQNKQDLHNLRQYLINRYHANATEVGVYKLYFKVNTIYSIPPETKERKCIYIDIQGKREVIERCDIETWKVCEIANERSTVVTPEERNVGYKPWNTSYIDGLATKSTKDVYSDSQSIYGDKVQANSSVTVLDLENTSFSRPITSTLITPDISTPAVIDTRSPYSSRETPLEAENLVQYENESRSPQYSFDESSFKLNYDVNAENSTIQPTPMVKAILKENDNESFTSKYFQDLQNVSLVVAENSSKSIFIGQYEDSVTQNTRIIYQHAHEEKNFSLNTDALGDGSKFRPTQTILTDINQASSYVLTPIYESEIESYESENFQNKSRTVKLEVSSTITFEDYSYDTQNISEYDYLTIMPTNSYDEISLRENIENVSYSNIFPTTFNHSNVKRPVTIRTSATDKRKYWNEEEYWFASGLSSLLILFVFALLVICCSTMRSMCLRSNVIFDI